MHDYARLTAVWIALFAMAFVLVACGAAGGPAVSPPDVAADVSITSRDITFDRSTLNVPAGRPFSLRLDNEDAAPHNVSIYVDESAAESRFVGELVSSAEIVYQVPALEAGTYFFRCDLHPEMNGRLVAD